MLDTDFSRLTDGVEYDWNSLRGDGATVGGLSPGVDVVSSRAATSPTPPPSTFVEAGRKSASSPPLPGQLPPTASSFDRISSDFNEPNYTVQDYETLTYDELHQVRCRQSYLRRESKSAVAHG